MALSLLDNITYAFKKFEKIDTKYERFKGKYQKLESTPTLKK